MDGFAESEDDAEADKGRQERTLFLGGPAKESEEGVDEFLRNGAKPLYMTTGKLST